MSESSLPRDVKAIGLRQPDPELPSSASLAIAALHATQDELAQLREAVRVLGKECFALRNHPNWQFSVEVLQARCDTDTNPIARAAIDAARSR